MEDDKFKKLIQNIDLEEPGNSFVDGVMKMIEAKDELKINPAVLSVIKNELLAEPAIEFPDHLMAHLQLKESKMLEPIIPKKNMYIIGGIIIPALLIVLINSYPGSDNLQNDSYFSHFRLNLSGITIGIIKIATPVFPYLIPLSILLLMDYLFRTKHSELFLGKQKH